MKSFEMKYSVTDETRVTRALILSHRMVGVLEQGLKTTALISNPNFTEKETEAQRKQTCGVPAGPEEKMSHTTV